MRVLIWLLLLSAILPVPVVAQQSLKMKVAAGTKGNDFYIDGLILYNKGSYAKAEKKFRQAFASDPNALTASYLYYALILQGKDLMASVFRKKNPLYTASIPRCKTGFEDIYTDFGPRFSANSNAGNMYYGDIGTHYRISPRLRFWQMFNYLQQDNNLGSFKQYETFSRVSYYMGKGWTLLPSVHYDYVPNTSLSAKSDSINEIATYPTAYGTYTYVTAANTLNNYRAPGYSNYTCFAIALSKTKGPFIFELEPSVHYIYNYYRTFYKGVTTGNTVSRLNGDSIGTKPYDYTDSGVVADTLTSMFVYQFGTVVTYSLPIRFDPVTLRFAAYYLFDADNTTPMKNTTSMAYSFYSTLRFYKKCWINLSWEKMGLLPWALNYEGLYFNFNNKINSRAGVTFQFYPLSKISAAVTYQYENDTRYQDEARLVYNSFYLSLKYNLCKR